MMKLTTLVSLGVGLLLLVKTSESFASDFNGIISGATNLPKIVVTWDPPTNYNDGTPLDVPLGYNLYLWQDGKTNIYDVESTNETVVTLTTYPITNTIVLTVTAYIKYESGHGAESDESYPLDLILPPYYFQACRISDTEIGFSWEGGSVELISVDSHSNTNIIGRFEGKSASWITNNLNTESYTIFVRCYNDQTSSIPIKIDIPPNLQSPICTKITQFNISTNKMTMAVCVVNYCAWSSVNIKAQLQQKVSLIDTNDWDTLSEVPIIINPSTNIIDLSEDIQSDSSFFRVRVLPGS